jgi:hypothetical protein
MRKDRELDESQRAVATLGGFHWTKSSAILGVITMLPALLTETWQTPANHRSLAQQTVVSPGPAVWNSLCR